MRREVGADRSAVAEHGAVDDRLAVDGMSDGPAHADVVERRSLVVDRENRLAFGRSFEHDEAVVPLEPAETFRRTEIGEEIDVAGQHRRDLGGRIADDLEHHPLETDRAGIAVARVLDQPDGIALDPFLEAERAGADGAGGVARRALRRNDDGYALAEIEQECRIGRLQHDDDGVRIGAGDARDIGEVPLALVGAGGRRIAFEGEPDIARLEGGAVGEGDALAQVKSVGLAILGGLPTRRQPGADLAVLVDPREPFENIVQRDLRDRGGGSHCRVEARRGFEPHADDDRILGTHHTWRGDRQGDGKSEPKSFSHDPSQVSDSASA